MTFHNRLEDTFWRLYLEIILKLSEKNMILKFYIKTVYNLYNLKLDF